MKHIYFVIAFLLLLFSLFPIWVFHFFPSQDGPSHLFNAFLLEHVNDKNFRFEQFYQSQIRILPNWTYTAFLLIFTKFFQPLTCEKIFISLYALLMPVSLLYFLKSVDSDCSYLGFLGFLFIYNIHLLWGFFNFVISIPIFLFCIGIFFRLNEKNFFLSSIYLVFLSILLYFSHIVSYIIFLLFILFISIVEFKNLKKFMLKLLFIIPSFSLFIFNFLLYEKPDSFEFKFLPFLTKIRMFFSPFPFRFFSRFQIFISIAIFCFYTFLFIMMIRNKLYRRNTLFLFVIFLVCLYFLMPNWIGDGGYINSRILIFIFLIALGAFSLKGTKKLKFGVILFSVFLSCITFLHLLDIFSIYEKEIKDFTSGIPKVRKNSLFLPLVLDQHGNSIFLAPFAHVDCYYYLATGGISHSNYEASHSTYFFVKYKKDVSQSLPFVEVKMPLDSQIEKFMHYDYVILWGRDEKLSDFLERNSMTLIHSQGKLKLYENRF